MVSTGPAALTGSDLQSLRNQYRSQEAKAEAQNFGRGWGNRLPGAWDGCEHPRAEVRPSRLRDQQTLSLGWAITKDMRTPDPGPQQWLLRFEMGVVVIHWQRRELLAVAGSGERKKEAQCAQMGAEMGRAYHYSVTQPHTPTSA